MKNSEHMKIRNKTEMRKKKRKQADNRLNQVVIWATLPPTLSKEAYTVRIMN